MPLRITWPDGKRFAFTVLDDTDSATLRNVGEVYALLDDCGFRTTKTCWMINADPSRPKNPGQTCEDPDYAAWLVGLQSRGFEIAWHNATWYGVPREQIILALERFARIFGHYPATGANHSDDEAIYWGRYRLTGLHVPLYDLLTRFRNHRKYRGHIEGDPYFWGDLCRQHIKFYRNFVFQDVNTLKSCPLMPYHDRLRPYVNYWFASSNGCEVGAYNRCLAEGHQDRLEEEGDACIMYTHFASGFQQQGRLEPRFRQLMERLAKKNGWFVPVETLLEHLLKTRGHHDITGAQRRRLERKWLWEKVLVGTV